MCITRLEQYIGIGGSASLVISILYLGANGSELPFSVASLPRRRMRGQSARGEPFIFVGDPMSLLGSCHGRQLPRSDAFGMVRLVGRLKDTMRQKACDLASLGIFKHLAGMMKARSTAVQVL